MNPLRFHTTRMSCERTLDFPLFFFFSVNQRTHRRWALNRGNSNLFGNTLVFTSISCSAVIACTHYTRTSASGRIDGRTLRPHHRYFDIFRGERERRRKCKTGGSRGMQSALIRNIRTVIDITLVERAAPSCTRQGLIWTHSQFGCWLIISVGRS